MSPARRDDDRLLTTNEAAHKLGVTRRYLYNLIQRGLITTIRLPSPSGRNTDHRIEPAEIERFKAEHRHTAANSHA